MAHSRLLMSPPSAGRQACSSSRLSCSRPETDRFSAAHGTVAQQGLWGRQRQCSLWTGALVHSSCYSATVRSSGVRQAAHHARALLPMGLELAAPHTPARRRVPVRGRGGRGSIQRRQGTRHSSTGDRRACGTARMPHRVAAGGPSSLMPLHISTFETCQAARRVAPGT